MSPSRLALRVKIVLKLSPEPTALASSTGLHWFTTDLVVGDQLIDRCLTDHLPDYVIKGRGVGIKRHLLLPVVLQRSEELISWNEG